MGKSAKFYKRPSKKEKEGLSIKKLIEPTTITKKGGRDSKKISVPASMFADNKKKTTPAPAPAPVEQDVEMDIEEAPAQKKNKKTEKEPELPDYVDLFSGKKTYKKIPKKRK
ncbi:hypothetical protein INT46_005893 [Mucor plumbeus]|jgi:hypothetical protein|uniref:Uncharacterized protein n=1 Tax=Mucor plumbeus TaxID=97098 RepID=A0A8H7V4S0_9FUNG|nr:hypothetical protein INT46_005893 [Mucor plumbeus]